MAEPPRRDQRPTPNPVGTADAVALIGVLAVLEGEVMTRSVADRMAGRLSRRLVDADLLPAGAGERDFRQILNDINQRLRFAVGEYEAAPVYGPVPE